MPNTVLQDKAGPDWPLGLIVVATPGTPVNIMSLVDSSNVNAPQTATPGTAGADEYTSRCNQIIVQGVRAGASHGLRDNQGNVYLLRFAAKGAGSGNYDDPGVIVACVKPGTTFVLQPSALNRDVFSPYRYYIDADTAADGALVTLIIQ